MTQRLIPGGPYANETGTAERLIPGGPYLDETVSAGAYTLTADAGTFTLSGQDAGLAFGRVLTADVGTFSLAGQDAGLAFNRVLTADVVTFTLSGQDATLTYQAAGAYTLTADEGLFVLSGQDAGLTYTPVNNYVLAAEEGTFSLVGQEADLLWSGAPVRTGGGHAYLRSNFVQARKRLHLQRLLDFLTEDEPEEETKRIIREVKAGKPVTPDKKAPVVMREVSAEKLAAKIKPERVAQLPSDIDLQQVIRRAIELAQEQDDEDILLLL